MKLYRNWIINEVARAGEHTNERTNVRTYVLTYILTGQTLYPLHNFVVRGDNNLTLKKPNFLFLLCFKIAIIQFIPMHQPSRQRHNFSPSHSALNLMLPAYLLGMILI